MADEPGWYIASVWVWDDGDADEGRPRVMRFWASSADAYRRQVHEAAIDAHGITAHVAFGPIGRSRVQA